MKGGGLGLGSGLGLGLGLGLGSLMWATITSVTGQFETKLLGSFFYPCGIKMVSSMEYFPEYRYGVEHLSMVTTLILLNKTSPYCDRYSGGNKYLSPC